MIQYFRHALPEDSVHAVGAGLLTLLTLIFPAEPQVYQGFAVLLGIDTVTGVAAAIKRKAFNSRSMRTKLLTKLLSYALIPGALGAFSLFLPGTGLSETFALMSKFTLASIAFIELTSILENASVLLDKKVTLRLSAKELKDLISSNHVERN